MIRSRRCPATSAPVTPRAAFAEELRRRLYTELEDLMTDQMTPEAVTVDQFEPGLVNHGSLFYFTLPGPDVERSARFYRELFDWELHRGDAGYHVANVYPPMGLASNDSAEPEVWIEVTDINAAVAAVRSLGGQAEDPVLYDSGWTAVCRDPQGVRFSLSVPRTDYRQAARTSSEPGELFYWTLPAPDADASRAFYTELFGWEFGDPGEQGGMHVSNRLPDGGLGGGREGTRSRAVLPGDRPRCGHGQGGRAGRDGRVRRRGRRGSPRHVHRRPGRALRDL